MYVCTWMYVPVYFSKCIHKRSIVCAISVQCEVASRRATLWLVHRLLSSAGKSILHKQIRLQTQTDNTFIWLNLNRDDLLSNVLPSYVEGLQMVIRTDSDSNPDGWQYTIELSKGNTIVLGTLVTVGRLYRCYISTLITLAITFIMRRKSRST